MTEAPDPAEAPSVFGARNQDEMLSRIGSTAEDDLSSAFFENSIADVEDAAVRMFDIGIKTITDDPASMRAAFGPAGTPDGATAPVPASPGASGASGRFADPQVRAAFILGGPAALRA